MNGRERATFTNVSQSELFTGFDALGLQEKQSVSDKVDMTQLIFNFVRLMANIPANLCCIDGNLHNEKTRYFNVRLTDTAVSNKSPSIQ